MSTNGAGGGSNVIPIPAKPDAIPNTSELSEVWCRLKNKMLAEFIQAARLPPLSKSEYQTLALNLGACLRWDQAVPLIQECRDRKQELPADKVLQFLEDRGVNFPDLYCDEIRRIVLDEAAAQEARRVAGRKKTAPHRRKKPK